MGARQKARGYKPTGSTQTNAIDLDAEDEDSAPEDEESEQAGDESQEEHESEEEEAEEEAGYEAPDSSATDTDSGDDSESESESDNNGSSGAKKGASRYARPEGRTFWTEQETNCFVKALKRTLCVPGAHQTQLYVTILALHGRKGYLNEKLKDRNPLQLSNKARNIAIAFARAGKFIPYWKRYLCPSAYVSVAQELHLGRTLD